MKSDDTGEESGKSVRGAYTEHERRFLKPTLGIGRVVMILDCGFEQVGIVTAVGSPSGDFTARVMHPHRSDADESATFKEADVGKTWKWPEYVQAPESFNSFFGGRVEPVKRRETAYIVAWMDVKTLRIVRVNIHSEGPMTLTRDSDLCPLEVMQVTADSYQDAYDWARKELHKSMFLKWAAPLYHDPML